MYQKGKKIPLEMEVAQCSKLLVHCLNTDYIVYIVYTVP